MSGVFGYIPANTFDDSLTIQKMGQILTHRKWNQVDTWVDSSNGVSLGRIGIGIFNKETQPAVSDDGQLILFFAGELFTHNFSSLAPDAPAEWKHLPDPKLILALYRKYGKEAFRKLEGSFQLALYDQPSSLVFIANDLWGTYPLCYSVGSFGLIFSPEYKVILAHPQFKKEKELDALAEFVKFQRVLGKKTFFKNIKRMQGATILTYSLCSHELKTDKYFDFSEIQEQNLSLEEAIETTSELLVAALQRRLADDLSAGVYLSGGADSRQVAGIGSRFKQPLHTITYGDPRSMDCYLAGRVARTIRSRHHQFPLPGGEWISENFNDHLDLTEGFHSWFNIHGITTIEPMREHIQVQLNGFVGDHLYYARARTGPHMKQRFHWDRFNFRSQIFHSFSQVFSWPNVTEADSLYVYHNSIKNEMRDRAFHSYLEEYNKLNHLPNFLMFNAFLLQQHAINLTHYYNVFFRSGMEIRLPFLDYDLFKFIHGLPPRYRYKQAEDFALGIIESVIPEVTHIPYAKDDIPLSNNKYKLLMGEISLRGRRIVRKLFGRRFSERPSLAVDYENLLRTDLKDWAEEILFDERTLDRGLFNPDYLKSIWARHQAGELHTIGKFAPMITYEMLLRKYYD